MGLLLALSLVMPAQVPSAPTAPDSTTVETAASTAVPVGIAQKIEAAFAFRKALTLPSWTPAGGEQLVLVVGIRDTRPDAPTSVKGNGLTWKLVLDKKDEQDTVRSLVYQATGPASAGSIQLAFPSEQNAVAAQAFRITGAASIEASAGANTGASDTATPSVSVTTLSDGALAIGAIVFRHPSLTLAGGLTPVMGTSVGSGGDVLQLQTASKVTSPAGTATIAGRLSRAYDWVAVAVALKPSGAAPTPAPSATPKPSATAAPTATPKSSATPAPTVTPKPSATAAPTATPTPAPTAAPTSPTPPAAGDYLLIDAADLKALPTSGSAWSAMLNHANASISSPSLSDQDDPDNVRTLAAALVYARTGTKSYRDKVVSSLRRIRGTDTGKNLALGRELAAYVLSADLIRLGATEAGYDFKGWLKNTVLTRVRHDEHGDRTLEQMVQKQGQNWGTMGQASMAAVYGYLGDKAGLARVARYTKGFMGDKSSTTGWTGWKYNQTLAWAYGSNPQPINPAGATKNGRNIDGVIHNDQARGCGFTWPPCKENYVWEALQGLVLAAELLDRQGYDAWNWENKAILRTTRWLHEQARFPAEGDDTSTPHIVNKRYGTSFPAPNPSRPSKIFGFTDWLYSR
jgi:hypothetical protein